jgi:GTPase Era involved in 16S rRNA processing
MNKIVFFLALVFALSASIPVFAVQDSTDSTMQILLEKIKADKKLLVASNMKLSDAEAKKFWPVYDAYQAELKNLNKRVATLIQDYADAYNNDTMTDAKAKKMINEMIAIDQAEASMKSPSRRNCTKPCLR